MNPGICPVNFLPVMAAGEGGYRASGTDICEGGAGCEHACGHAEPRLPAGDRALAGPGPSLPHF